MVVVGGGNIVVEEVFYLLNIVLEVYLVYCCDSFCSEKILIDCLMDKVVNGNIVLYMYCILDEVLGDEMGVIGVCLKDI